MKHGSFSDHAFPGRNTEMIKVRVPKSLLDTIIAEAAERNEDLSVITRDALLLWSTPKRLKAKLAEGLSLDGDDMAVLETYRVVLAGFVKLTRTLVEDPEIAELNRVLENPNVQELMKAVATEAAKKAVESR